MEKKITGNEIKPNGIRRVVTERAENIGRVQGSIKPGEGFLSFEDRLLYANCSHVKCTNVCGGVEPVIRESNEVVDDICLKFQPSYEECMEAVHQDGFNLFKIDWILNADILKAGRTGSGEEYNPFEPIIVGCNQRSEVFEWGSLCNPECPEYGFKEYLQDRKWMNEGPIEHYKQDGRLNELILTAIVNSPEVIAELREIRDDWLIAAVCMQPGILGMHTELQTVNSCYAAVAIDSDCMSLIRDEAILYAVYQFWRSDEWDKFLQAVHKYRDFLKQKYVGG